MGHWYFLDGTPCHTITNEKTGKTRNTDLRDARKLGLRPSVTTIIGILDKPALAMYKQKQLLDACADHPFVWGKDEEAWRNEVVRIANIHAKERAKVGSAVHAAIDKSFTKEVHEYEIIVKALHVFMQEHLPDVNWVSEKSFCVNDYAGTVDLHSLESNIVLDFKTKDVDDITKILAYAEHSMQLVAYAEGLGLKSPRCINIFINTRDIEKPEFKIIEHTKEQIDRAREMFYLLVKLWKLQNKVSDYVE
jgi:hypothetical protein